MVSGYEYENALDFWDNGLGIEGCNSASFDDWSFGNGVLAVATGGQAWTLVSCPGDMDSRDRSFSSFLSSWPTMTMSDNGFMLASGGTTMTFVLANR